MKDEGIINPKIINKIANPEYQERLEKMAAEMAEGFNFLENFDKDRVVTIFGSAQVKKNSPAYNQAKSLGRMLAEAGITVVTGGGPGIMEAANYGAYSAGGRSVGINIYLQFQERKNPFVNESIAFNYFFVRKLILAHIAQAYVYFPGGFGTLDEFFEISTLLHTKKIEKKMPVVLVGKQYWQTLKNWIADTPVKKHQALKLSALEIWDIVDSAGEAFSLVSKIPNKIIRAKSV